MSRNVPICPVLPLALSRQCLLSTWWNGGAAATAPHDAVDSNDSGDPQFRLFRNSFTVSSGTGVQGWGPLPGAVFIEQTPDQISRRSSRNSRLESRRTSVRRPDSET